MSDLSPDKVTPYIGLMPYAAQDAPFFFGREREQAIIMANLMAARLTILYGPSGVGKTSVLRAGVEHTLLEQAQRNLKERGEPELAVVVFSDWRDDPIVGLSLAVQRTVKQTLAAIDRVDDSSPDPHELVQNLETWTKRLNGELLFILDQVEEYFLYHPQEDGEGTFAVEFPRVVNSTELRVNFLVSLREDALSKLDRFKGRIPSLFDNYLRIEHLTPEAARDAIEKPLKEYNRRQANEANHVTVEPVLVDAVLSQVQTGRVTLTLEGSDSFADSPRRADATIETSYLQLVMTRLWEEEWQARSQILRLATLEHLQGAEYIVRTHLDSVIGGLSSDESEIAAAVFRYLVTPSGTKIAYTVKDLAAYTNMADAQLTPVLERLAGSGYRILRTVDPPPNQPRETRYEIFHDVLAAAVLDWRARYMQEREKRELLRRFINEAQAEKQRAEEKRRQRELDDARKLAESEAKANRRLRRLAVALVLVSLVAILAVIMAWNAAQLALEKQNEAQSASAQIAEITQAARSRELALAALDQLDEDPERGLLIAIEAEKTADTLEAQDAMRQLLRAFGMGVVLLRHDFPVNSASFSPDGKYIVTASNDETARMWEAATGKELAEWRGHTGPVYSARFSPNGKQIVTASDDETARVWDVAIEKELAVLSGHTGPVYSAQFSPDGKYVVTAGDDRTARIWEAVTGQELAVLRGHEAWIISAQFSPNGKQIVTASGDGTARVWDAETGKELLMLRGHEARVIRAQFSPDGRHIVTASDDKTARVWEAATGEELAVLGGHEDRVTNAQFSPDGKYIVTASNDGTARVWDAAGQELAVLRGHETWVNDAQFSPDGKYIATASGDGTARIWEAPAGKQQAVLRGHTGEVYSAKFSPDGKYLVTAGVDGTARVYLVHIEDLIALAKSRVTRELTCEERVKYLHEDRVCPAPTPAATATP